MVFVSLLFSLLSISLLRFVFWFLVLFHVVCVCLLRFCLFEVTNSKYCPLVDFGRFWSIFDPSIQDELDPTKNQPFVVVVVCVEKETKEKRKGEEGET